MSLSNCEFKTENRLFEICFLKIMYPKNPVGWSRGWVEREGKIKEKEQLQQGHEKNVKE